MALAAVIAMLGGFHGAGAVIGTVLATAHAGIVLCWLRIGSGSLLAPVLAHIATNSVTFVLAWVIAP